LGAKTDSPASLRVWLVIGLTIGIWLIRIHDYFGTHAPKGSACPHNCERFTAIHQFTQYLSTSHEGLLAFAWLVLLLLAVSQLRIFCGVEFADESGTFQNAKGVVFPIPAQRQRADTFIRVIVGIELALTVVQSYFMSVDNSLFVPITLALQAGFIALLDMRLLAVFINRINGRRDVGLLVILANDLLFALFAGYWLYLAYAKFSTHWESLTLIVVPGVFFTYCIVFIVECCTIYAEPMIKSAGEARRVLFTAFLFTLAPPYYYIIDPWLSRKR